MLLLLCSFFLTYYFFFKRSMKWISPFLFCCSFLLVRLSVTSSKNPPSCRHPIFPDTDSPFHFCLDGIVHLALHYNHLDFQQGIQGESVGSAI